MRGISCQLIPADIPPIFYFSFCVKSHFLWLYTCFSSPPDLPPVTGYSFFLFIIILFHTQYIYIYILFYVGTPTRGALFPYSFHFFNSNGAWYSAIILQNNSSFSLLKSTPANRSPTPFRERVWNRIYQSSFISPNLL